jgi:hypothetical protein
MDTVGNHKSMGHHMALSAQGGILAAKKSRSHSLRSTGPEVAVGMTAMTDPVGPLRGNPSDSF